MQTSRVDCAAFSEEWFDCVSSMSETEFDSGVSDDSDHNELDEEYEMNADLADPESGYLLGKAGIANHLW